MSLINQEIKSFSAMAFHKDKFINVSEQDLIGKWSIVKI